MLRTPIFTTLALAALAAPLGCGGDNHTSTNTGGSNAGGSGSGAGGPSSGAGAGSSTGTGAGGTGTSSGTGAGGSGGGPVVPPGSLFEAPNEWTKPVDTLAKSGQSDEIIQWLDDNGGWGTGSLRIDFSIAVLAADASTPLLDFTPTGDFYSPDCNQVPFPVPAQGALEGEQGYACVNDGDCHLLVVHQPTKKLYEMWRANIVGGNFEGGCTAVWDLTKAYPPSLRGEQCTSADAGGFPISAMLFSADEIFAKEIAHAIRFILPNARIRNGEYVHPATHSTGATSGGPSAPPYGVRFRLRSDFPLDTLPSDGARVVAKALQKYGMLLADGGNIALTASDDRFTSHKWADVGVDAYSLDIIQVTDMEVVDLGTPVPYTGDCVLNP